MNTEKTLTEKAMLVRVSISQWTARRHDAQATREVIENHGASSDAGRFNKALVDPNSLRPIQKIANEARTFHYSQTLPWGDDDSRILPAENYLEYTKALRDLTDRFETAARDFAAEYPALIERARSALNGLFRADDYPNPGDILRRFAFSVSVSPLPDASDFRVSLGTEETARIRAQIERDTQAAVAAAMRDLWERLRDVIAHAAERLRNRDAIFRDSLIGNIAELCALIPRLNLTGDPALAELADLAARTLGTQDPDDLRRSELARSLAAKDADAILAKMAAYMEA